MKRKLSVVSIVFYVVAALFLFYTLYSFNHTYVYLKDLFDNGTLVFKDNEYDIISFYMQNCGSYLFYAVCLAGIGRAIQSLMPLKHENAALSTEGDSFTREEDETDSEAEEVNENSAE